MLVLIRLIFVAAFLLLGYFLGSAHGTGLQIAMVTGLFGLLFVISELALQRLQLRELCTLFVGIVSGLIMANLLLFVFYLHVDGIPIMGFVLNICFAYIGGMLALSKKNDLYALIPWLATEHASCNVSAKILDTSVIIDGRIVDICRSKFVEGELIIPRFILKELQGIADSADSLRRQRGRRGLDILKLLQDDPHVSISIVGHDFPEITDVDAKLIMLAKQLDAKIFTNDYNLNKVANLQSVVVLNINDLSNALKPVVLPGEELEVQIMKEGKEYGQGVAYLEDGTMVVVDNGRAQLGRSIRVTVTSIIQTSAGRMIFTRYGSGE